MKFMNLSKSFLLIFSLLLIGCNEANGKQGNGRGQGHGGNLQNIEITTPIGAIEKEGLLFMWEEEKLARDVYLTMNEKYGHRVFNNISGAEQRHMNAIKSLLLN